MSAQEANWFGVKKLFDIKPEKKEIILYVTPDKTKARRYAKAHQAQLIEVKINETKEII